MKKTTLLVIAILIFLTILKLYKIDGGFVPAEPDERNYLKIVSNFRDGPLSQFDGIPLYHSPPFFHYLGFIFSFVLPNYLSIRFVSLIASLVLAGAIYFYMRSKVSLFSAALGSCLFLILPLVVYYSRLGLLEMLIALCSFGFIAAFEFAWRKDNWRWAILSGLSLGLGLITKYSILPLLGVPVLIASFYFVEKIWENKSLKFILQKEFRIKVLILFVLASSAALVFGPVTFFNYTLDPFEFKSQLKQDFALGSRAFEFNVALEYLNNLPSYFTWLGLGLMVLGLTTVVRQWRQNLPVIFSTLLLTYALLRIALYTPRYFVILAPFLSVVMIFGLENLMLLLGRITKVINVSANLLNVGLVIAALILILPASKYAIDSSYHTKFEEVGNYIKKENSDDKWIGSNYWPSAFVDQTGYKISWYSLDHNDSNTLSGGGKTRYLYPGEPLFDLINREGGWVIVEQVFSPTISRGQERKGPIEILQKSNQPIARFVDQSPNWPYNNKSENEILIYRINGK